MRVIVLALCSFILAAIVLVDRISAVFNLSDIILIYLLFAVLACALLLQVEGFLGFKKGLSFEKIEEENDKLREELRANTEKLHDEKKQNTEYKCQVAKNEKNLLNIAQERQDDKKQIASYRIALEDANRRIDELERSLLEKGVNNEADIVHLLGLLQEKGRLIDFLMDDVTSFSDQEVGAAARIVHQGCSHVLREYFDIRPISAKSEGDSVRIENDSDLERYETQGPVTKPPFAATVVHRGWIAEGIRLPKLVQSKEIQNTIYPAQLELGM